MLSYIKNKLKLFIILFFVQFLSGQNYPSTNISMADGLPNNQIECIYKDSRGILWVGTHNGLAKIEGGTITNYSTDNGLSNNSVWDIVEDAEGNLWFATFGGGISKFDGKEFTAQNHHELLKNSFVRKLFIHNNYLLIGTEKGLFILNLKDYSVVGLETEQERFQIMDYFTYKGEIYIGVYTHGIYNLNTEALTLTKIRNTFKSDSSLGTSSIFSLYINNGDLYYGSAGLKIGDNRNSIIKFKTSNFIESKDEDISFGNSIIWDFTKDSNDTIYCAAWGVHKNDGGLFKIADSSLVNVTKSFGIKSDKVRTLFYDMDFDFLYVGTQDKGLYQLSLSKTISFFNDVSGIIEFKEKNSDLYILHEKGLSIKSDNKLIKNQNTEIFFNFFTQEAKKELPYLPINGNYNSFYNSIKNLEFYDLDLYENALWVSSSFGLFKLNLQGDIVQFLYYSTYKFLFLGSDMLTAHKFEATNLHLDVLNKPKSNDIDSIAKIIPFSPKDKNNPVYITKMLKYKDLVIVSSSKSGLHIFKDKVYESLALKNIFSARDINNISLDNYSKTLLVSTNTGDVFLLDMATNYKVLTHIKRDEIVGNSITLLENHKEALFIGTEKGLNIYQNGSIRLIDVAQGLKINDFTTSKIIKDTIYVGTQSGYYKIDLEKILNPKKIHPSITLTNIKVNYQKDTTKTYTWFNSDKKKLTYKYWQNILDLSFKTSNYPYPNKLRYSYQIEGLDPVWSIYSTKQNIFIPYLPIGTYNVNIKIKDLNTGSISLSKLAAITIVPPFWKTWWFISLLLLVLLISGFIAFKNRIKYIKKREQQKAKIQQRLVETKLEALQSQMNPHFTFNAMNSIQNYIIDNDIDNALMYLSEFAKLIRTTLENSSKHLILLAEEISYLKSYIVLENMRFNNKVNVTIDYDGLEANSIEIPPMIIQPFVENAFVHAFNKNYTNPKLSIKFYIENQLLICIIEDNGKGMNHTNSGQLHESKGLKLVMERLNLLNNFNNNSFKITSEEGKGTKVILQFELIGLDD